MRISIAAAVIVTSLLASPLAWAYRVEQVVPLKNGWTVLVFDDGKMSMRDDKGRPRSVWSGTTLETADGRTLAMRGNETWRRTPEEKELDWLYRGSK